MVTGLEVLENLMNNSISNPVDMLPFPVGEKFVQLNFSKNLAVILQSYDLAAKARKHEVALYEEEHEDDEEYQNKRYKIFDLTREDFENKSEEGINKIFDAFMEFGGRTKYSDDITNEHNDRLKNFLENKHRYPELIQRIQDYHY